MKPLNQSERRSIYLRFLLLYLISIAAIIFTMYFYFSIPGKELEEYKSQSEKYKDFDKIPRAVLSDMIALDEMYKKASDRTTVTSELKSNIEESINNIKEKGKEPKNALDSIYKQIGLNFNNWKDDKFKIMESNASVEVIQKLKEDNKKYQDKLDACESLNTILKAGAGK